MGKNKSKLIFFLFILLLIFFWPVNFGQAETQKNEVVVLTVDGPIVPVVVSYLDRGISYAEENRASFCLIKLNTPGGLYQSTQQIVSRILSAQVPVVVYVFPQGGWAASAGTFITVASHYAVMSPGSRIGAAHPVSVGPEEEAKIPGEKITEDAAAWIRSLAQMRGRNVQAAELTVKKSKSYSDKEALEKNLIDARARSLEELLAKLNGKSFTLRNNQQVTVKTKNISLHQIDLNWREKFLLTFSNPEIAYLLFTLGMLGLMVEIYHPGAVFPGLIGGLSLLLGLYGLGTLDAYWVGLLLLVLAFGLFIAEAFFVSHGLLGTGGLVSFVLGSLLLFSGNEPGLRVSPWLIFTITILFAGLLFLLVMAIVRGQKRRVTTGQEGAVGQVAVTRTPLTPKGTVLYAGGLWQATTEEGRCEEGEEVIITGMDGLKLRVKKK
ncbi:MAG TPA: serine protease [Desulfotomaculum sp.]|nr:serine protease [Desulfotomaculum sp.]